MSRVENFLKIDKWRGGGREGGRGDIKETLD